MLWRYLSYCIGFYFLFGFGFLKPALAVLSRLILNSQSSRLRLLSTGIIGVSHHAQLGFYICIVFYCFYLFQVFPTHGWLTPRTWNP